MIPRVGLRPTGPPSSITIPPTIFPPSTNLFFNTQHSLPHHLPSLPHHLPSLLHSTFPPSLHHPSLPPTFPHSPNLASPQPSLHTPTFPPSPPQHLFKQLLRSPFSSSENMLSGAERSSACSTASFFISASFSIRNQLLFKSKEGQDLCLSSELGDISKILVVFTSAHFSCRSYTFSIVGSFPMSFPSLPLFRPSLPQSFLLP